MPTRLNAAFACVVCILILWASHVGAILASEPSARAAKTAVRESFKFDPDEKLVIVPVRVGSRDYRFVLDTGSTVTVVDNSLRQFLGPRIGSDQMSVASGREIEAGFWSLLAARVGTLRFTQDRCCCLDLTPAREASGCDIRGVLGMDFLKRWIIRIDFDEGRLEFLNPGTPSVPERGEYIPITFDENNIACVSAVVGNDATIPFRVDTGAAITGSLDGAILRRVIHYHEFQLTGDEKHAEMGGGFSSQVGRLLWFSIGSFRHHNLRFSSGASNVIGLGYLSRYRVTIDFPGARLYLAKGKQFADPDYGCTCGLFRVFKTSGVEVMSVDSRGPAFVAGAGRRPHY